MRIVILVKEGLVEQILASEPVEVLLVDRDVREELETREIVDTAGKKLTAALVGWNPTVDSFAVDHYFKELQQADPLYVSPE
mgnify:FL=1